MKNNPRSVAQFMLAELEKEGELYQETIVEQIVNQFGNEFTYENEDGNLAIDKRVLKEFRQLTEDSVIWERSERMWRKRTRYDVPGRQQD